MQNQVRDNVHGYNTACHSVAGVLFNKSQTTLIQRPLDKAASYAIPNRITSIGDSPCVVLPWPPSGGWQRRRFTPKSPTCPTPAAQADMQRLTLAILPGRYPLATPATIPNPRPLRLRSLTSTRLSLAAPRQTSCGCTAKDATGPVFPQPKLPLFRLCNCTIRDRPAPGKTIHSPSSALRAALHSSR
jgi:hypothetical protein